ncbi:MAG: ankyrin repeat domain-containing protein [Thermoanaerobaculia bacterium]
MTSRTSRVCALVLALFIVGAPAVLADEAASARKKLQKMGHDFTPAEMVSVADSGDAKAVELFLKAGMDPDSRDSSGRTPLLEAADDDNAKLVAMLLKAKASVNLADQDGKTPLFADIHSGQIGANATPLLVAAGASLETVYEDGNTIVHEAVIADQPARLKVLLDAGARVDAPNGKGETPLFLSASYGRSTTPVLIAAKANLNTPNADGTTPLIAAADGGETESVRLLLEAGADVKAKESNTGRTALIAMAGIPRSRMESFHVEESAITAAVEALLASGSDVNARTTYDGKTALLAAAEEGHDGAVAKLIAAKADVNVRSKPDGYTPLMQAAKAGYADVVQRLLAAGADPKIKDRVGRTAAKWSSDHPDVAALLGGKAAPVKKAAAQRVVSAEQKEAAAAKLDELGYRELTEDQFVASAHEGNFEAAQAFLDYGLSVNSKSSIDHATTPLLAASTLSDPALGVFLIKAGADVNAKDENGSTPLIWASQRCGMTDLVKALLDAGANPNAKSAGGASALMMAGAMNCTENVKLLTKAGAKK